MRWLRAEFAGLRPTPLAHNIAGVLLALVTAAMFWLLVTTFFPWCAS